MDWAQYYAQLTELAKAGEELGFFDNFFRLFYQAFIEGERWRLYLKGMGMTFELTVFALCIGIVLGVLVAVIRTAHDQQRLGKRNLFLGFCNGLCKVYTTVIRGTPMMVQLLIWGFVIFSSSRNKTMIGALGIGINSGAYVAEIVRGGLMSVDIGQSEAGRSLGLNYLDTMRFIVIPQAFKNILPALGNEFITLFKDTSLVSAIGGAELIYYARAVGAKTYEPMFPYLGVAVMYLAAVLVLTWLQGKLERRLRQSDRR
jgi:His/Glu/Gln/Arg/opine family amino acid ABC transporter permease subunit